MRLGGGCHTANEDERIGERVAKAPIRARAKGGDFFDSSPAVYTYTDIQSHTRYRNNSSKTLRVFPGGSESKESACDTGEPHWIPGSGRFPEEGNGNPLQYSCLENPMDRGARWVSVRRVTKSRTGLKQLIRG